MPILVATRSAHKLREIREILGPARASDLRSLADFGLPPDPAEDDIETHATFLENALAKAAFFARRTGLPTIADDSGIVVHVLGGEPGVRSKRWSGRDDLHGQDLDDANNALLIERLRGVPPQRRTAHYACAAALVRPGAPPRAALATCNGTILDAPRGTGGFGYDPLFLLPDLGLTFGQLPPELKNLRSHRARAFRALAAILPPPSP